MSERKISKKAGIEIGCRPGPTRPDSILKSVVEQIEELSEDDFIIHSKSFGDWDFAIYEDKEDILEKNFNKIYEILSDFYGRGIIRFAHVYPEPNSKK